MSAPSERIPLPLVVDAPGGFHVLPRVGYADLDLRDARDRRIGQVHGSAETTRLLRVIPVDALWRAELVLRDELGDEHSIATAAWEPKGGLHFPPMEITDSSGKPSARIDDWNGTSGHLESAEEARVARIDSPNPLNTTIRFHIPGVRPACEAKRRGVVKGREIFDWTGPDDIDARLVLAWLYALSMRASA